MPLVPPDPPLSDGVVTLRPWREEDVPSLVSCCGDAEIAAFIDQIPQPYREEDARVYVEHASAGWNDGTEAAFALTAADGGEVLGSIGVRWLDPEQGVGEVGYWVRREARGRGVATRGLQLVARWTLREVGLARLQLRADERNAPSRRVAQNAGFTEEGTLRSARFNARQRRRVDFVMYSLLPGELA